MSTNYTLLMAELVSGEANDGLLNKLCDAYTYDECDGMFGKYLELYKFHDEPLYSDWLTVVEARTSLHYLTPTELKSLQEYVIENY